MLRYTASVVAALCAVGCATTNSGGGQAAPTTEKLRIVNQSYFDLANCSPRTVEVGKPATKESLIGFLVSARPQVMECLVDPKHRGAAKETHAIIQVTVSDASVDYDVSGPNLTPEGIACIKEVYTSRKGLNTQPKGVAAVTEKAEIQHAVGVSPSVVFGTNEASDVVGKIRISQKAWCECYADWSDKPPQMLKAKLSLSKPHPPKPEEKKDEKAAAAAAAAPPPPPPVDVTFEPTNDPTADKVAACLKAKVLATPFEVKSEGLLVPYSFILVHSGVPEELASAPNDVKFIQLEQLRAQRAADAVIALGARQNAATSYDQLVQKYQKTKDYKLVRDLESGCSALGKANEAWIAALSGQLDMDKKTLTLISNLKASDAQWGEAEAKAQESVTLTEKDVAEAKKIKEQNVAICPKTKK